MSSFWGVEVKPGKPYTLTYGDSHGRLRLTQATLGNETGKGEKGAGGKKCVVQCSVNKKDAVFLCSLVPEQSETCHLELEFEEEDVTFSVIGPRSVHLVGYYIAADVPTTCSMQFPTRPPTSPMATAAAATTATTVASPSTSSSPLLLHRRFLPPASAAARRFPLPPRWRARLHIARRAAVGSDVSSSPDVAAEVAAAAPKVGKRVRVTAPVRVHHVAKAPGLELRGMEGVVKQYVGVWKAKRVTANLPFKVEFELKMEGQENPVRFFAHLRESEFEIVGDE